MQLKQHAQSEAEGLFTIWRVVGGFAQGSSKNGTGAARHASLTCIRHRAQLRSPRPRIIEAVEELFQGLDGGRDLVRQAAHSDYGLRVTANEHDIQAAAARAMVAHLDRRSTHQG